MKKIVQILTLSSILFSYGQVGVNTRNPKETLDIEGTLRIKNVGDYDASSIPLSWDSTTGKVLKGSTTTQKPFYTTQYIIKPEVNGDWISNWNTNIPSDKYTAIITSGFFQKDDGGTASIRLFNTGFLGPTLYPFVSGKTWRLYADFASTRGVDDSQYQWILNLMVINNNLIKSLDNVSGTITSGSTGSSANPIP